MAIALGIKAAHASYPVLVDSATGWINRWAAAHATGNLGRELKKLNRYRALIIGEVGSYRTRGHRQKTSKTK